jgi:AcrR family transcriptional regulator
MPPTDLAQTRRHILEAAEDLIRRRGIGATTTRAIAEKAGCAEGTIYRHFPDKHTLLCELVDARFPDFRALVGALPAKAGSADLRTTLEEVGVAALTFYRLVVPLAVMPLADHELLEQQRRYFRETGRGPMRALADIAAYLRREQELGRLSPRVSPPHVARMFLGACFSQAFVEALVGDEASLGADADFVALTVDTLLEGAAPR